MPIPPLYRYKRAYHFCSLTNVPSILKHGLLSPNEKQRLKISHYSVAEPSIQRRRSEMIVPCGPGGKVHDYVPFYFCERSSMLQAVIRKKNIDQQFIVYFAVPITILEQQPCVFTSASANTDIAPTFYDNPSEVTKLNWKLIDSRKWRLTDEEKRLRMAELLVHTKVEIQKVSKIVVWNDSIRKHVEKIYADEKMATPAISVDTHFYYNKFPLAPDQSLVTGPYFTRWEFEQAVEHITKNGQKGTARYENINALLAALRADLRNLSETSELVGLESENEMHSETVGDHTLSVVRELLASPEYAALNPADQQLTELAAYLHDIGKGPKSRWVNNGGKQQVDQDHPIESVKMLRRILTEEIGIIDTRSVRVLAKLVCYGFWL